MLPEGVSWSHLLQTAVIFLVVICVTILRARGEIDTATTATVYGAALGFAPRISSKPPPNGSS